MPIRGLSAAQAKGLALAQRIARAVQGHLMAPHPGLQSLPFGHDVVDAARVSRVELSWVV